MAQISIIMPAYNAERYIGHAITSVLAQTYEDFELIICDDASTDASTSVARSYRDRRIKLLINDRNMGQGYCRDRAADVASGRWITVLDADDAYAPRRLEALHAIATSHPGAVIFDEIMVCHDTRDGLVPWKALRGTSFFPEAASVPRTIPLETWICAPRTLAKFFFPTELARDLGIHHSRIRFAEDLEFALRLLAHSHAPLVYLSEPLYLYRLTSGSMSTVDDRLSLQAGVLEDAVPLFKWNAAMQQAIQQKLADIHKAEVYQAFFSALMQGKAIVAGRRAMKHPWVLRDLVRRSVERLPYHTSRLRHRGARRETT